MDKLKILKWNCRGLNNKINYSILFSAEKGRYNLRKWSEKMAEDNLSQ